MIERMSFDKVACQKVPALDQDSRE